MKYAYVFKRSLKSNLTYIVRVKPMVELRFYYLPFVYATNWCPYFFQYIPKPPLHVSPLPYSPTHSPSSSSCPSHSHSHSSLTSPQPSSQSPPRKPRHTPHFRRKHCSAPSPPPIPPSWPDLRSMGPRNNAKETREAPTQVSFCFNFSE